MAYVIKSAIGKIIESQSQWEALDLTGRKIPELLNIYSEIRVTLENPFDKSKGSIRVEDYEFEIGHRSLDEWLVSIGDRALTLGNESTVIKERTLLFREALSNKFKVVPVEKGKLPDNDFSLKDIYSDLFITKEAVDPVDMYKHTLVTVNGYIHATDANSNGLWVTDGYTTMKKRRKHCIGVISFEQLGELTQIPIKESMIAKLNDQVDLYHECILDIGVNTTEKTIILVLGGYLHVLDYDVFSRISDTAIRIKFRNIPLLERVHQSMDDMEYTDILFDKRYGETNLTLVDLYSDEFLRKYLTCSQSFIVLLDNTEVFKEITYPQQRGIPNNYLMDSKPVLPMMTRLGKFEEYVAVKDIDKYVLETADCQYRPRVYNLSQPIKKESFYNAGRLPQWRYRIPTAYFFNLRSLL